MGTTDLDDRYHVVCRDCRTERLYRISEDAETFASAHESMTGHAVVFERVD